MPKEFKAGCQRPTIKKKETISEKKDFVKETKKEELQMIKVGKPAPNFNAPGFYDGKFMDFDLSEYKGKWVLLCFYPGDFTFV
ncbi:peroxiredoxin [Senegalia massiliensis]|uniref:Peroxiredoxin n=2 Tax=Senegalia massiliensis TaxID=1720316 RepID=A0A845QWV9_9CLOT|nr:peroxiredoxin [Senegalia massiliensis]